MPSGAKKRKAAKKKLAKQAHNSRNGSHSQGVNDAKPHDEREENVDRISLEQENAAEKGDASAEESYKEVAVDAAVVDRDFGNGNNKSSSSSSSSGSGSSSGDEEVVIEKEKQVEEEVGGVEQQEESSLQDAPIGSKVVESAETVAQKASVESSAVDASLGETIPVEKSIKQVPEETGILAESVREVLQTSDEKSEFVSPVVDSVQEKNEEKVIPVVEADSVTVREGESLLPQSSSVEVLNESNEDENLKESETQKYVEEQPLLPSAVLPVRRTSWINCCGLFEVLSGGSSG